jgi:hypothetical protein
MPYTHPIDRFVIRFRPVIIVLFIMSVPVYLISYGWMARELFLQAPVWVSVIVMVAHCFAALGIASLFDMRHQQDPQ